MQNSNELDFGAMAYVAYRSRITEALRAFAMADNAEAKQQARRHADTTIAEAASLGVALISLGYIANMRYGRAEADLWLEVARQALNKSCGEEVVALTQFVQRQGGDDLASKLKAGNS